MATQPSGSPPTTDIDLFADETLLDPYESYRTWRDAGPAVWSTRHEVWILSRFDDVKRALADNETYISGKGVGLYGPANEALEGTVIASDPPEHGALRRVLADRMSPRGIRALQPEVEAAANSLVDSIVAKGSFDAMPDLARKFPLMVMADLIGLPGDDHGSLLGWADAGFNTFGPANDRAVSSMPIVGEMFGYIASLDADPSKLREGSMGREIYEASERGELKFEQCGRLMAAYLMAGLDTTISSIANAVWLFGRNPEQWTILALGFGIHNCAGQGVARLEAHSLLAALARKVERFEVGTPKRHLNNLIRNFDSLPVTLVPAAEMENA